MKSKEYYEVPAHLKRIIEKLQYDVYELQKWQAIGVIGWIALIIWMGIMNARMV
jgi:hypothetical protein